MEVCRTGGRDGRRIGSVLGKEDNVIITMWGNVSCFINEIAKYCDGNVLILQSYHKKG